SGQWGHFGQALVRALGYLAIFLLVYLVSQGQLGFGDVKFSVSCGLTMGWYAPGDWLLAIWITFLLAGLISITGLLMRKLKLRDAIAFGPYMFGAVVIVSGFRILVGGASG
ncbi:MAG: prepilin peptidase, partial [Actinomycetales bacterium]|nr:prepilin peptidase [Actinomycetales bacterium]